MNGAEETGSASAAGAAAIAENEIPVTELPLVWLAVSVIMTAVFSGLNIVSVITGNKVYFTLSSALMPTASVFHVLTFLAQPKRRDKFTILFLLFHFLSLSG